MSPCPKDFGHAPQPISFLNKTFGLTSLKQSYLAESNDVKVYLNTFIVHWILLAVALAVFTSPI